MFIKVSAHVCIVFNESKIKYVCDFVAVEPYLTKMTLQLIVYI